MIKPSDLNIFPGSPQSIEGGEISIQTGSHSLENTQEKLSQAIQDSLKIESPPNIKSPQNNSSTQ